MIHYCLVILHILSLVVLAALSVCPLLQAPKVFCTTASIVFKCSLWIALLFQIFSDVGSYIWIRFTSLQLRWNLVSVTDSTPGFHPAAGAHSPVAVPALCIPEELMGFVRLSLPQNCSFIICHIRDIAFIYCLSSGHLMNFVSLAAWKACHLGSLSVSAGCVVHHSSARENCWCPPSASQWLTNNRS